jgi:hypothetical protein
VLKWYYRGPVPVQVVYDVWVRDQAGLAGRVDEWARGRSHLWLLISRPWLQDPEYRLKTILDSRYGPASQTQFDGVLVLRYDVR